MVHIFHTEQRRSQHPRRSAVLTIQVLRIAVLPSRITLEMDSSVEASKIQWL